jgi:hypothetical protein
MDSSLCFYAFVHVCENRETRLADSGFYGQRILSSVKRKINPGRETVYTTD